MEDDDEDFVYGSLAAADVFSLGGEEIQADCGAEAPSCKQSGRATALMPTSMTTQPGFSQSPRTNSAFPIAATTFSPP